MRARGLLAVILVLSLLMPIMAFADKKNKKQVTYYIPQPDALPHPSFPEHVRKPLAHIVLYTNNTRAYPTKRYGIDVSRYQGKINWKEVAKDKRVTFVYMKATESTGLVDPTYKRNHREARRAGLPVGVYHFFSPQTPAQQQLANFRNTVNPRTQDLIPIVDVEVAPKRRSQIVPFLKRLRTFVNGVEKYFGCKPIIYTSQSFYNKFLAGKFLDCPFMFAKYSNEVPQVTDNPKFLIWQFTASGRIRGISGDVDRSCLMNGYTLDDIRYKRK